MLYASIDASEVAPAPVRCLPRPEALARAAELDAALHRAMRERGEELIPREHLQLAAAHASRDACPCCAFPLSSRERLAWRKVDGAYVVTHAGCVP